MHKAILVKTIWIAFLLYTIIFNYSQWNTYTLIFNWEINQVCACDLDYLLCDLIFMQIFVYGNSHDQCLFQHLPLYFSDLNIYIYVYDTYAFHHATTLYMELKYKT